jgi:hypothetical protein
MREAYHGRKGYASLMIAPVCGAPGETGAGYVALYTRRRSAHHGRWPPVRAAVPEHSLPYRPATRPDDRPRLAWLHGAAQRRASGSRPPTTDRAHAMSPFQAIQYVGTPIALVAFAIAVAAYAYRSRLVERRRLIEAAPEGERGRLLDATIKDFTTVNTETLTREQRYTLALRLIDERAARFRMTTYAAVATAALLAIVVLALPAGGADDVTASLTVRVHDPDGAALRAGAVTLDAGPARDTRDVAADGQVRFDNLPRSAFRDGVRLTAHVPGYASAPVTLTQVPRGGVYYLELQPAPTRVYGTVVDSGRSPAAGVVLHFDGGEAIDTTDANGTFSVLLRQPPGARVPVRLFRDGVVGFNDVVTLPDDAPLTLRFDAGG